MLDVQRMSEGLDVITGDLSHVLKKLICITMDTCNCERILNITPDSVSELLMTFEYRSTWCPSVELSPFVVPESAARVRIPVLP